MNLIFGAGGHSKEIEWLLQEHNKTVRDRIRLDRFVVEDQSPLKVHLGLPSITESEVLQLTSPFSAFIAIGLPSAREKVYRKFLMPKIMWPSLVHYSVVYDMRKDRVRMGEGAIIFPSSTLTTNVQIGKHVHINAACSISHDVLIGDFCTISPGVKLAGGVRLAERVFIGIGAVLIENVCVCADAIVGAGSVVVNDIVEPGTYVGTPAKRIK